MPTPWNSEERAEQLPEAIATRSTKRKHEKRSTARAEPAESVAPPDEPHEASAPEASAPDPPTEPDPPIPEPAGTAEPAQEHMLDAAAPDAASEGTNSDHAS